VVVDMGPSSAWGRAAVHPAERGILVSTTTGWRPSGAPTTSSMTPLRDGGGGHEAFGRLGTALDKSIAEPLYAAIHTDTGGSDTRDYARNPPSRARFLELGVDPQRVYTEIFERQSATRLRLTGAVLEPSSAPLPKSRWLESGARW